MKKISSLHMAGISLGGSAAVFTSHYNDLETARGQKLYNSVTAICPVINLRDSLDYEFMFNGLVGFFFTRELKNQLLEAKPYLKDVGDMIGKNQFPKQGEMTRYVASLSSVALAKRGIKASGEDWLKWNNFFNIKENPRGPLLAIAAKDDSIVNTRLNSLALKTLDRYQNDEQLGVIVLPKGNHCAFHTAYGLPVVSMILRDHVIRNSPEYFAEFKEETVIPQLHLDFQRPQKHVSQKVFFNEGTSDLFVEFKYFSNKTGRCTDIASQSQNAECISTEIQNFPISHFARFGARVPKSSLEAEQLTREFNSRIQFLSKGKAINGTGNQDIEVRMRTGF